ncbi:MAG TPA: hypothetical protein VMX97_07150 [Hyphomicrobiaceae bacterium]|nr:hypothetical protein [Hyphomicrobiaceae bacterium]
MDKGIRDQINGLERERRRLEALLAPDENWRAYQNADAAQTAQSAQNSNNDLMAQLPASVAGALGANRLFNARAGVIEAVRLLSELVEPSPIPAATAADPVAAAVQPRDTGMAAHKACDDSGNHLSEAFRTKLKVKASTEDAGPAGVSTQTIAAPAAVSQEPGTAVPYSPGHGGLLVFLAMSSGRSLPALTGVGGKISRACPSDAGRDAGRDGDRDGGRSTDLVPHAGTPFVEPANGEALEHLDLIHGMTSEHRDQLLDAGVTRCSDIAAWNAMDVARFSGLLGPQAGVSRNHISRDQWIEQAAVLASGRETHHARRLTSGAVALLVERPQDQAWQTKPLTIARNEPGDQVCRNTVETVSGVSEHQQVIAEAERAQATLNARIARLETTVLEIGGRGPGAPPVNKVSRDKPQAAGIAKLAAFGDVPAASPEADVEIIVIKRALSETPRNSAGQEPATECPETRQFQGRDARNDIKPENNTVKLAKSPNAFTLLQRLERHRTTPMPEPVHQGRDAAAYTGTPEEASVRIVRGSTGNKVAASSAPAEATVACESAGSDEGPPAPRAPAPASAQKFLRALTGDR